MIMYYVDMILKLSGKNRYEDDKFIIEADGHSRGFKSKVGSRFSYSDLENVIKNLKVKCIMKYDEEALYEEDMG